MSFAFTTKPFTPGDSVSDAILDPDIFRETP